jgi:predicted phosphodiesterase
VTFSAIGDIHGHSCVLLAEMLSALLPESTDTIVFLGDYVGLGPDIAGTLDSLIAFDQRC